MINLEEFSFLNEELISLLNNMIENGEEFEFSIGEWGKRWFKINYKKGKISVKKKRDKKND